MRSAKKNKISLEGQRGGNIYCPLKQIPFLVVG